MRNVFIGISALLLLGAAGGATWWLQADQARLVSTGSATSSSLLLQPATPPPIAAPTATPNIITVGTSTPLLFTVPIPEPTLNPASVTLLRVNANGSSTVVAQMVDNGQNGDQKPGDKVFTARLTLNEPQAGTTRFQVSAAFRGVLRRALSPTTTVLVWVLFTEPSLQVSFAHPPEQVVITRNTDTGQEVAVFGASAVDTPPLFAIRVFPVFGTPSLSDMAETQLGDSLITTVPLGAGIFVEADTLPRFHYFERRPSSTHGLEIYGGDSQYYSSPSFTRLLGTVRY